MIEDQELMDLNKFIFGVQRNFRQNLPIKIRSEKALPHNRIGLQSCLVQLTKLVRDYWSLNHVQAGLIKIKKRNFVFDVSFKRCASGKISSERAGHFRRKLKLILMFIKFNLKEDLPLIKHHLFYN